MYSLPEILKKLNEDFFIDNDESDIHFLLNNKFEREDAINEGWLGYPPATIELIQAVEDQLNVKLPRTYKEFFLTSNGFGHISYFLNNLFPVEKIVWARNVEPEWWFDLVSQEEVPLTDEQYYVYGKDQEPNRFRGKYLRDSLKISEWYDGMCVFLNPAVKFGEEWEVLAYATWNLGAERYKSFLDFLVATHELNEDLRKRKAHS